ncbi:MAG: hypothetical protein ONB24_14850 [candidate division KSB1 bacterium]|nr:hypothetical protein [candidate division KSB1 bacterium]
MNGAPKEDDREFWRSATPFLLSAAELRRRFGPAIESLRDAMTERFADRPAPQRADIAIWFAESVRQIEAVVAAGVELLAPPSLAPAMVGMRGLAGARNAETFSQPLSLAFEKAAPDCRLSGTAMQGKDGIDVQLSLKDARGKALRPFLLSVQDEDQGKWYVRAKAFEKGEALLRGMQPGRYRVRAEAGPRSCEMTLEIRAAKD